jgi:hypothetical protein
MYATVFKKDPLSPKLGAHYREEILKPGGSREEADSLKVSHFGFVLSGSHQLRVSAWEFLAE